MIVGSGSGSESVVWSCCITCFRNVMCLTPHNTLRAWHLARRYVFSFRELIICYCSPHWKDWLFGTCPTSQMVWIEGAHRKIFINRFEIWEVFSNMSCGDIYVKGPPIEFHIDVCFPLLMQMLSLPLISHYFKCRVETHQHISLQRSPTNLDFNWPINIKH